LIGSPGNLPGPPGYQPGGMEGEQFGQADIGMQIKRRVHSAWQVARRYRLAACATRRQKSGVALRLPPQSKFAVVSGPA